MSGASNTPLVFLSHAKKDESFIKRVEKSLRDCQIRSWLDSIDIRHGEPWLEAIFHGGIAPCDCILVYFTENSIESEMVKKEIDAAILKTLKDSHVGFLPYVSQASLREQLRPDLQTLQVAEWNSKNYRRVLPRVVSEVWRSYMERVLRMATAEEKSRRLEAELELQKLKASGGEAIFSPQEDRDFAFICHALDRAEEFVFERRHKEGGERAVLGSYACRVNLLSSLTWLLEQSVRSFTDRELADHLVSRIRATGDVGEDESLHATFFPRLGAELQMYNFLGQSQYLTSEPPSTHDPYFTLSKSAQYVTRTRFDLQFTEKVHRFRYWLAVSKKLPEEIRIERTESPHS